MSEYCRVHERALSCAHAYPYAIICLYEFARRADARVRMLSYAYPDVVLCISEWCQAIEHEPPALGELFLRLLYDLQVGSRIRIRSSRVRRPCRQAFRVCRGHAVMFFVCTVALRIVSHVARGDTVYLRRAS